MKVTNRLIVFISIGLITMVGWTWQSKYFTTAPEVTFSTITGKKIELAKLQGKPVLITFWATDCPSCIKEIPHLIDLYNQFHPQGLEIIAVAMYYDPPNHVVAMSKAKQIPYDVALDLKGAHAMAFGQVQLIPTTLLISPTGKIIMQKTGVLDKQRIEQLLSNV